MIMDMIRLGIDSYFTKRKAYFICIADYKMLGHQLQSGILGKFPSKYHISMDIVNQLRKNKTADKVFDERFINKFEEMKCSLNANLIFDEAIQAKNIIMEKRILVWEITRSETKQ